MKPLTKLQRIAYNTIRYLDGAASPSVIASTIARIERRFLFGRE